jgi:septal ring factor EnvC (AmiA/AmiB activator)
MHDAITLGLPLLAIFFGILLNQKGLSDLKADIRGEMATQKAEFRADIAGLRSEMASQKAEFKSDIADLRSEMKSGMASLREEFKSDIADLRKELKTDIADLRKELKTDISRLESKIDRMHADIVQINRDLGRHDARLEALEGNRA